MNELWFKGEQLSWFEELNPYYYIFVAIKPEGEGTFEDEFELSQQIIQLKQLPAFKSANASKNLWRSWEVYREIPPSNSIGVIPLYFDIDDVDEHLEQAYNITTLCVEFLRGQDQWFGSPTKVTNQLRVTFSGHKGFHIEAKPIVPVNGQIIWEALLKTLKTQIPSCLNNTFYEHGNTVLDLLRLRHSWLRITDTIRTFAL